MLGRSGVVDVPRVGGRESKTLELRRIFLMGDESVVAGAVMGVMGVAGVRGAPFAVFPFILESHFLVDGVMAILASESFIEMERRRRCGGAFLIMGDAALVAEFSYGSELRNACDAGDAGVRGGKGAVLLRDT